MLLQFSKFINLFLLFVPDLEAPVSNNEISFESVYFAFPSLQCQVGGITTAQFLSTDSCYSISTIYYHRDRKADHGEENYQLGLVDIIKGQVHALFNAEQASFRAAGQNSAQ